MPEVLTKPTKRGGGGLNVQVPAPKVRVKAPDVSVDGLNVSINGITVTVDSREFAQAIGAMGQQMGALAQAVMQIQAEHGQMLQAINAIASRETPAPVVNVPAISKGKRGGSGYDVALVRDPEDNEILGFRIRPVGE